MNAVQQRQRQRFLFLKYLYEKTGGDTLHYVAEEDIAKALGFTDDEQEQTSLYLRAERLITGVGGPKVALTHRAVVEVEAALAEPNKPTPHFPVNILHIEQMTNSLIQQGTVGSTQVASFSSDKLIELSDFIQDLKVKLPDLNLSPDDARVAQDDIAIIETQAASPRPKWNFITECLHSIRNIAEGTGGSMIAAGIIQWISKFLGS